MNGSDAHPASTVNKITWPRYVTLDSLISSPILAGWASDPFMLPPCTISERPTQASAQGLGEKVAATQKQPLQLRALTTPQPPTQYIQIIAYFEA